MSLSSEELQQMVDTGIAFRERVGKELADFAVEAAIRVSTAGNHSDLLEDLAKDGMYKPPRDERRMAARGYKKAVSDLERAKGGASAILGIDPNA